MGPFPSDGSCCRYIQKAPDLDRSGAFGVAGARQPLEGHPPFRDVAVAGEVRSAGTAVSHTAEHLVLLADQFALPSFGCEGEGTATAVAEPSARPGHPS